MDVVILAGGLGKRLRPLTYATPKPLLPVGSTTVIERLLMRLRSAGVERAFICINYMAERIRRHLGDGSRYGLGIRFVNEDDRLGTCGPLRGIVDEVSTPFLVHNGDIVTDFDYGAFAEEGLRDAKLVAATTRFVMECPFGVVSSAADRTLTGLAEKPTFEQEVLAGIYLVDASVVELIPPGKPFGMDELIHKLLARGDVVRSRAIHEFWMDIGNIGQYERAQALLVENLIGEQLMLQP
jgi:NDP-sugar pyrophosphorylase family protein